MRSRTRIAGGAAAVALAGGAVVYGVSADGGEPAGAAAPGATATTTAPVERRDLVDRETVTGTLGYGDARPLVAGAAGTLTRLRGEGDTVRRGGWLYELDGARTGWLLYGRRPAWRDLRPGMSDGADVRQLEANLRALGHDPDRAMDVDGEWTAATTAAVKRFQEARELTEDGSLVKGEVVFQPGAVRIGELRATVGRGMAPGAELGELSGTRREVSVKLAAERQDLARRGASVVIDLPDGEQARGRVASVGTVAEKAEDGSATISVRVALRGRAARGSGLDQAPVDVGLVSGRARGVLTVPVTALLARPGGGYALEVAEGGRRRLVAVRPGLYADDTVEVRGDGLREGMRVVVPS